jgi:hypothetical protein
MKQAVKECIERNILKDFLETHTREVINMLMTEWNWDDAFAVHREEALEEGRKEGREESQNMILNLMRQGYSVEQIEAELAATKPAGADITGK